MQKDNADQQAPDGRRVPVLRTANSLIDDEFDSLRSRFDDEMRLMEQEMARFRSQMIESAASSTRRFAQSQQLTAKKRNQHETISTETTRSRRVTSTSSRIAGGGGELGAQQLDGATTTARRVEPKTQEAAEQQHLQDEKNEIAPPVTAATTTNWIESFANSPIIVQDDVRGRGEKLLKLRFDVHDYQPDKIFVKTIDNRLQVHAEREQKTENRSLFTEYNREFLLPAGVDPESIASTLSADGVLTIEAPLP